MYRLLAALILASCGLADTAAARPRTVPDQIETVSDDHLTLKNTGKSVLAGIVVMEPEKVRKTLAQLKDVDIKSIGLDRYGRARVLFFAPEAPQPVQVELLGQGAAVAYDMVATPATWRTAENEAKSARRGVWGTGGWTIPAAEAEQYFGTFHRVGGTVTRTYQSRDSYYINFGEDWKTDFSVMIPRKAWRGFGEKLEVPVGASIMARGTIIHENGPMIVVTRPEQLEILHAYPR